MMLTKGELSELERTPNRNLYKLMYKENGKVEDLTDKLTWMANIRKSFNMTPT